MNTESERFTPAPSYPAPSIPAPQPPELIKPSGPAPAPPTEGESPMELQIPEFIKPSRPAPTPLTGGETPIEPHIKAPSPPLQQPQLSEERPIPTEGTPLPIENPPQRTKVDFVFLPPAPHKDAPLPPLSPTPQQEDEPTIGKPPSPPAPTFNEMPPPSAAITTEEKQEKKADLEEPLEAPQMKAPLPPTSFSPDTVTSCKSSVDGKSGTADDSEKHFQGQVPTMIPQPPSTYQEQDPKSFSSSSSSSSRSWSFFGKKKRKSSSKDSGQSSLSQKPPTPTLTGVPLPPPQIQDFQTSTPPPKPPRPSVRKDNSPPPPPKPPRPSMKKDNLIKDDSGKSSKSRTPTPPVPPEEAFIVTPLPQRMGEGPRKRSPSPPSYSESEQRNPANSHFSHTNKLKKAIRIASSEKIGVNSSHRRAISDVSANDTSFIVGLTKDNLPHKDTLSKAEFNDVEYFDSDQPKTIEELNEIKFIDNEYNDNASTDTAEIEFTATTADMRTIIDSRPSWKFASWYIWMIFRRNYMDVPSVRHVWVFMPEIMALTKSINIMDEYDVLAFPQASEDGRWTLIVAFTNNVRNGTNKSIPVLYFDPTGAFKRKPMIGVIAFLRLYMKRKRIPDVAIRPRTIHVNDEHTTSLEDSSVATLWALRCLCLGGKMSIPKVGINPARYHIFNEAFENEFIMVRAPELRMSVQQPKRDEDDDGVSEEGTSEASMMAVTAEETVLGSPSTVNPSVVVNDAEIEYMSDNGDIKEVRDSDESVMDLEKAAQEAEQEEIEMRRRKEEEEEEERRREQEERERKEREEIEREEREKQKRIEKERRRKENEERIRREKIERERIERERREREEQERLAAERRVEEEKKIRELALRRQREFEERKRQEEEKKARQRTNIEESNFRQTKRRKDEERRLAMSVESAGRGGTSRSNTSSSSQIRSASPSPYEKKIEKLKEDFLSKGDEEIFRSSRDINCRTTTTTARKIGITYKELATLFPGTQRTDRAVIECYCQMLQRKYSDKKLWFMSTAFFDVWDRSRELYKVKEFTEGIDLVRDVHVLFLPVFAMGRWSLFLAVPDSLQRINELRVIFFDVTGAFDKDIADSVCMYFGDFVEERYSSSGFTVKVVNRDMKPYFESQDSGILILHLVRSFVENFKPEFEKVNIINLRLGAVKEINTRTLTVKSK